MDWVKIAYWLQKRGLAEQGANDNSVPWLDPIWFPEVENDASFNIFTFTFRGCEGGCSQFMQDEWYLDVEAGVDQADTLEDVDGSRVIMIGASIGADGVEIGCAYLNEVDLGVCLGAVSFSLGNYLMHDYEEIVQKLDPIPA